MTPLPEMDSSGPPDFVIQTIFTRDCLTVSLSEGPSGVVVGWRVEMTLAAVSIASEGVGVVGGGGGVVIGVFGFSGAAFFAGGGTDTSAVVVASTVEVATGSGSGGVPEVVRIAGTGSEGATASGGWLKPMPMPRTMPIIATTRIRAQSTMGDSIASAFCF
jgi:hypothetical protein